jgi:hypothetical protein
MGKPTTKPIVFFIFFMLLFSLLSCEYEFIEFDKPDSSVPVKFSESILPIFTTNDNCTACHRIGFTPVDFTAGKAYNTIVPRLINVSYPDSSKIYLVPNATSTVHQYKKLTPREAALVLEWIRQGAENN